MDIHQSDSEKTLRGSDLSPKADSTSSEAKLTSEAASLWTVQLLPPHVEPTIQASFWKRSQPQHSPFVLTPIRAREAGPKRGQWESAR
jgi:hypothetical protein